MIQGLLLFGIIVCMFIVMFVPLGFFFYLDAKYGNGGIAFLGLIISILLSCLFVGCIGAI